MAVPVIEGFQWTENGSTSSNLTLTAPSGITAGELLLLIMVDDTQASSVYNSITGWTFAGKFGDTLSDSNIAVFWKKADGTEGNVTSTITSNVYRGGWYIRVSGAEVNSCPFNGFEGSIISNGTTLTRPATYTQVTDTLSFYVAAGDGADTSPMTAPGNGWTEQDDQAVSASTVGVGASWGTISQTGTGVSQTCQPSLGTTDGGVIVGFNIVPENSHARICSCTEAQTTGTGTSVTIDLPPTAVEGSTVVICAANDDNATNTSSINQPSGWSTYGEIGNATYDVHQEVFIKTLTAADVSAGTLTITSPYTYYMAATAIHVDGHIGWDNNDVATNLSTSSTMSFASITTSYDNALVVGFGSFDGSDATFGEGSTLKNIRSSGVSNPGSSSAGIEHAGWAGIRSSAGEAGDSLSTTLSDGWVTHHLWFESANNFTGTVPEIASRTTTDGGASTSTSLAVNKPSGVTAGDLLIVIAHTDVSVSDDIFSLNDSSFIKLGQDGSATYDAYTGVWYKIADGTEGTSVTVSWDTAAYSAAHYLRITGHDPWKPIRAIEFATGSGDHHAPVPTAANGATGVQLAISAMGGDGGDTIPTITDATSIVESQTHASTVGVGYGLASRTAYGDTGIGAYFNQSSPDGYATVTINVGAPDITFKTDWERQCKLTIANGKVSGSSNLTNFVALITADDFPDEMIDSDLSNRSQADGYDIRFTTDADGSNPIPYERVHYTQNSNPASAVAEFYVRIPSVSYNTDTDIYVWYNLGSNSTAIDVSDPVEVWQDYYLVSHDGGANDVTGNFGALTNSGSPGTAINHLGITGAAASYTASNTMHYEAATSVADETWFDLGSTDVTAQLWGYKTGGSGDWGRALHLHTASPDESIMIIANSDTTTNWAGVGVGASSSGYYKSANDNAWQMVHVISSAGTAPSVALGDVYVNGSNTGNTSVGAASGGTAADEIWIGARNDSSTAADYAGYLAEIRIRLEALTSDWITTEYNNQIDDGTFWTAGTPAPANIVIKSVTDTLSTSITDSASRVILLSADSVTPNIYDDGDTGIVIAGSGFGASQGTGKVELCDSTNYATGTKTAQTVTNWSDTSITITGVLPSAGPSYYWLFVTNDGGDRNDVGLLCFVYREPEFQMVDSTNLTHGLATSQQLTSPTGGSTTFYGGRVVDTSNTSTENNPSLNDFTEYEFSIKALDAAPDDQQYEFRLVVIEDNVETGNSAYNFQQELDYYTAVPKYTIQSVIPKTASDNLSVSVTESDPTNALASGRSDTLTLSLSEARTLFGVMARSDAIDVSIDEITQIFYAPAVSDTFNISLDEITQILVTVAGSDNLDVSLTELAEVFKFVMVAASDNLSLSISEVTSLADTLLINVFDYLQVDFPDKDYTWEEVEALRENDNINALFRFLYQADDLTIGDFETFATSSFGWDEVTAIAVDAITPVAVSDTLTASITEAVDLLNMFSRIDQLDTSITESVVNALTSSRADTLSVQIAGDTQNILSLSRSDTLSAAVVGATIILVTLARTDTISASIDEITTILTTLARTDTLDTTLSELVTMQKFIERTDDLDVTFVEAINILVRTSQSDDLDLSFTEAVALLNKFATSDTLSVAFDEVAKLLWATLEAYRWRDDDGDEANATWLAGENTTINRAKALNTRLRVLLDTSSDTDALQLVLQYRRVGDPDWEWRDVE